MNYSKNLGINKLTIDEIVILHDKLIDIGKDDDLNGFLNKSALEFALDFVEYNNTSELFFKNIALLMRNIAGDHAFIDCNKRTAFFLASLILLDNNLHLDLTSGEIEIFVIKIAQGKFDDLDILANFLEKSCIKLDISNN